jgi:hypothetical protein
MGKRRNAALFGCSTRWKHQTVNVGGPLIGANWMKISKE